MHILFLTPSFPSPEYPFRVAFLGNQVRLLCERTDEISRVTVLAPTTYVPRLPWGMGRWQVQSSLPRRYELAGGRGEVLFPRYLKAPGNHLLRWTTIQWTRLVNRTVSDLQKVFPVDLIHANSGGIGSWAGIRVAKRHGIPCAVTYQGSEVHVGLAEKHSGWKLCRESFESADLNLCVSHSLENILRLHAKPAGRCEVLLRGVDQTRFFPAPALTRIPKVVYVGRLEKAKGVFDLVAAWRRVHERFPAAVLTFVGPDWTNGLFPRHVATLGLQDSIAIMPPVDSSRIAEILRASRLLCLPSHGEGTPNVVAEAMASGLPVVATRVGGTPDLVTHGQSGLLIEKGDVDELAASLIGLLDDYDSCVRLGKTGLAYARQHLDAGKSIDRLIDFYKDLVWRRAEATRTQLGEAATKCRNISRKDAKVPARQSRN